MPLATVPTLYHPSPRGPPLDRPQGRLALAGEGDFCSSGRPPWEAGTCRSGVSCCLQSWVLSQPDPLPSHPVVAEANSKMRVRVLVSVQCWGLLSCPPGPHRLPPVPPAPGPGDTGCPSPLTHTHTHTHTCARARALPKGTLQQLS